MGGKVAQVAASRRPEGLSGLILVAPAQPRLKSAEGPIEMLVIDNAEKASET